MLTELLFLGLSLVAATEGKHWALVVAGSNGWINYRHQVRFTVLSNSGCWCNTPRKIFRIHLTSFNILPSPKQFAIVVSPFSS